MKLGKLAGRGIGRCRSEWEFPVDKLGAADRVIAIIGHNGAGKTTVTESLPAVLYGSMPSRGPVAQIANSADSFIEAEVETDQVYRLQRKIRGGRKNPTTEAYLFDANGKPLNDGKQSTFNEEVAKRMPSERVFLASGFASQKRAGQFLEIEKAERKSLFVEMIGCGGLQKLSDAAGERASAAAVELEKKTSMLSAMQSAGRSVDVIRAELAEARQRSDSAASAMAIAESAVEEFREKLRAWESRMASAERDRDAATAKAAEMSRRRDDLVGRRTLLVNEIAGLVGRRAALSSRLASKSKLEDAASSADGIDLSAVKAKFDAICDRVNESKMADVKWLSAAESLRRDREAEKKAHAAEFLSVESEVRAAAAALSRLEGQAKAVDSVPCKGQGGFSGCPLISQAVIARSGVGQARAHLDELREKHRALAGKAPTDLTDDERLVRLGPRPVVSGDDEAKAAASEFDQARRAVDAGSHARAKLAAMAEIEREVTDTVATIEAKQNASDALAREVSAAAADADAARSALESARAALLSVHDNPPVPPSVDVVAARSAHELAGRRVAALESEIELAGRSAEKAEELRLSIASLTVDVDDWRSLAKAFGKDGIQALEIDAAGPEVSAMVNQLLHSCFGTRFTARLETTALKRDGGLKEVFDLVVLDTENGHEGSASDLSGGEAVIVGEALSLAIAIFNAGKSAIPIRDLWRDECAGALHPETAPLYLTMLRRALDLGGFHRCYFITHQPDLWEQADAVVEVVDGQPRLRGQVRR